jgi:hypothetical protein
VSLKGGMWWPSNARMTLDEAVTGLFIVRECYFAISFAWFRKDTVVVGDRPKLKGAKLRARPWNTEHPSAEREGGNKRLYCSN